MVQNATGKIQNIRSNFGTLPNPRLRAPKPRLIYQKVNLHKILIHHIKFIKSSFQVALTKPKQHKGTIPKTMKAVLVMQRKSKSNRPKKTSKLKRTSLVFNFFSVLLVEQCPLGTSQLFRLMNCCRYYIALISSAYAIVGKMSQFKDVDRSVLEAVLEANKGSLHLAIEALKQMIQ